MPTDENKALVRRFLQEAFTNPAILDALIAPDYVWRSAEGVPATTGGPDLYRQMIAAWWGAFPDLHCSIEDMVAEGDRVVTRLIWYGTHQGDFPFGPHGPIRATGRQIAAAAIIVSRIAGGRIVEEWELWNASGVWRQLGAI